VPLPDPALLPPPPPHGAPAAPHKNLAAVSETTERKLRSMRFEKKGTYVYAYIYVYMCIYMCIEFSQHGPVSELVALTGSWRATLKKTCKWPSGDAVFHRSMQQM